MDNSEAIELSEAAEKPEATEQPKKWSPWYTGHFRNIYSELALVSSVLKSVFAEDLFQNLDKYQTSTDWSLVARVVVTLHSIAEYFTKCIDSLLVECDIQLSQIVLDKLEKLMPIVANLHTTSERLTSTNGELIVDDITQAYYILKGVVSNTQLLLIHGDRTCL